MKVTLENGINASAGCGKPCFAEFDNILQELRRCEERKQQQSVEVTSATTKQKILRDHLQQTQAELAAARASKLKLCEEIGTLKQAKEHQNKQLEKYEFDLQFARETHASMTKKLKDLETSTWTIKQQYIQSLASRIKSSVQVLRQLNVTHPATFNVDATESCSEPGQANQKKRKRVLGDEISEQQVLHTDSKPEESSIAAEIKVSEIAAKIKHAAALDGDCSSLLPTSGNVDQNDSANVETELRTTELLDQISKLELAQSALKDMYTALEFKHNESVAKSKELEQDAKNKGAKIEELEQEVKIAQSTTSANSNSETQEKEVMKGRLKILEENLAQMNGYADQLEMVIAQCPSCTLKLQSESTQDSVANKVE
ncbi:hypothetical protein CCR75_003219 [Bremia lactucae]|uniref:Uncharacterized protein n=1 Tax=Bremia lactucae TaxID=4779 RepID=A0A976IKT0_BRELC|nr:hypothetical protein CCR75_003219 [Bremia lactucae]